MQILEEFWYGNIHPNERHCESNIEMIKISDLIKRHEGTLIILMMKGGCLMDSLRSMNNALA